jgi:hypothetical protein
VFATELGLPDWSVGVGYYDVSKLKKEIVKNGVINLNEQEFIQIEN